MGLARQPATVSTATADSRFFCNRQYLLILDHVVPLTIQQDYICDLLDAAPRLRILVAARAPLDLPQEGVLSIRGLQTPAARDRDIRDQEAIQLFLQNSKFEKD